MSLSSLFSKKHSGPTSVADALAGNSDVSATKVRRRKGDSRKSTVEDQQLLPERKRARRRLIGAIAMVLAVVIILPMVLDSKPKSMNKNIVIQIPSKELPATSSESNLVVAAATPVAEVGVPNKSSAQISSTAETQAQAVVDVMPSAIQASSKILIKEALPQVAPSQLKTENAEKRLNSTPTGAEAHPDKGIEAARAQAILDGIDPDSSPSEMSSNKATAQLVVQVGAFATQDKVDELRSKLSSAGISSYTQKIATSSGDKIRVRIGPFPDTQSALKVKSQLEKLGLSSTLLAL